MKKPTIDEIIARNVRHLMERPGSQYPTPNKLGKATGLSPNTIRNLLDPNRRSSKGTKLIGSPTIDTLQAVARKFGREAWELVHPDIERAIREREMYASIEYRFKGPKPSDGDHSLSNKGN